MNGGETVVVGLIGARIGGSFSLALHEREASLLGFDYEYPCSAVPTRPTPTAGSATS